MDYLHIDMSKMLMLKLTLPNTLTLYFMQEQVYQTL